MARSGLIGRGFRVPMIVASPWSRGGWVNSQLFERNSTLRFLKKFIDGKFEKKVTETNISPWRRTISGDLTSCFRPYEARERPLPGGFQALSDAEVAVLRSDRGKLRKNLPQETGTRPACAVP